MDNVIGSTVEVKFNSIGGRTIQGKVDTGATTSSIHAVDITTNQDQRTVTFSSDILSNNLITMEMAGSQDVSSADGGEKTRPTVQFDIEINGIPVQGVLFNLNDRSEMSAPLLIGQNVLQAGDFIIDVKKDEEQPNTESIPKVTKKLNNESSVMLAVNTLVESDISLSDLLECLTIAYKNKKHSTDDN